MIPHRDGVEFFVTVLQILMIVIPRSVLRNEESACGCIVAHINQFDMIGLINRSTIVSFVT